MWATGEIYQRETQVLRAITGNLLGEDSVYKHTFLASFIVTRHSVCLGGKQSFVASMDECNELFFQPLAAKSLSFTEYKITKTIIPATQQLKWQIL
jgi:hypothetical protein